MRIKLFFIHPTNYGNMMMAASFISQSYALFKKQYQDKPVYYVDVLDQEELNLVRESLPKEIKIKGEFLFDRKRRGVLGKMQKLVYVPYEIYYNKKNYDACVVLGGDCISQYYSKQKLIFNMVKFHYISKRIPVYAPGQTMGPFSGIYSFLVKWGMKNCDIYTREHTNYIYLKEKYQFNKLHEARDLAALDIPFQNDGEIVARVLEKYIGDNKYVTYVPSGVNHQYTSNLRNYIDEYIRMIINTLDNTDFDIVMLAHVIHTENSNDKKIIDLILPKIPSKYSHRIKVIDYLIKPYEARIILGHGEYTITGRMHAAISSLNMDVIPICLSYSIKYKGVIGDVYGFNEYIVQCRGDEFWDNQNVSKSVLEIETRILSNKETIVETVQSKNQTVKEMALQQIVEIVNKVGHFVQS